jgi:RimJ/RimL family protein N-acetyltransferase
MTDGPARLRNWSPADGAWYVAQLSDADIQRFTTERHTTTADDFRSALKRLGRRPDQAGFAIVDAITGELAGNWRVRRIDLWTHAENIASQHAAQNAGFRHEPGRDEIKTIGGRSWPVRWYSCAAEPDSTAPS